MCDNSARSLLQEGYGIVAPSRSNSTHHHSEEIALQVPNRDRTLFPDQIAHRQRWYTAIAIQQLARSYSLLPACFSSTTSSSLTSDGYALFRHRALIFAPRVLARGRRTVPDFFG